MTEDLLTPDGIAQELRALAAAAAPARRAQPFLAEAVINRCPPRRRWRRRAGILVGGGLVALAAAGATRPGSGTHFAHMEPSGAMEPTVRMEEQVVFDKGLAPERGDVVLAHRTIDGFKFDNLSRVVALGGDTIACPARDDGRCAAIVLNGSPVSEPHLEPILMGPFGPTTVPNGSAFLMGDNRNNASDSRVYGPVRLDDILGVGVRVEGRPIPGAPPRPAPGASDTVDPAGSSSDAPSVSVP